MTAFDEATKYLVDEARAMLKGVPRGTVSDIMEHVRGARHVVIFGRGRSGLVARTFAVRLGHLGFRAFVVGETSTPPVSGEDVVVLVSGSGETFSVTLTAQIARNLGAKVVSVTATPDSTLAAHSDVVLLLSPPEGEDKERLAPLGSVFELAAHLLFDGIVAELMAAMGETERTMQKRHATLE